MMFQKLLVQLMEEELMLEVPSQQMGWQYHLLTPHSLKTVQEVSELNHLIFQRLQHLLMEELMLKEGDQQIW